MFIARSLVDRVTEAVTGEPVASNGARRFGEGLAANYGFKAHELNEIEGIIREHWAELMEAWHEHLGG